MQSDTQASPEDTPNAVTIGHLFLSHLLSGLVGSTKGFAVTDTLDERGVLFTVTANSEVAGRIIGKKGATANAIRALLNALGGVQRARYALKVTETSTSPAKEPVNAPA